MFGKKPERLPAETLGSRIAGRLDRWQRRLADNLNRRVGNCSKAKVLFALIVFCLMVGSYLACLLFEAFSVFS